MKYTKLEYVLKHNVVLQKLYCFFGSLFFRFLGLFIKNHSNYILFQSMIGRSFGDSPRMIYDKIITDPFFKDYQFFWAFLEPDKFEIPIGKKIKLNSISYFITALKCRVWVGNSGIERGLHFKPKQCFFINTGHGSAFKKVGNAVKGRKDFDFSDVDLLCTTSEFDKNVRIRDTKARPEAFAMVGYPVNDFLYHLTTQQVDELKLKYNIPKDKIVICYAPTWRDEKNDFCHVHFDLWRQKLSKKYVVLFRAHHLDIVDKDFSFDDFLINASSQFPSNEILAISDILITDYSSIVYEFSILKKPIFLYTYDLDDYLKTRGLYISPFDLFPNTTFLEEQSLLDAIYNIDYERECAQTKLVKEKYMFGTGEATDYCINAIKQSILKSKTKTVKKNN